MNAMKNKIKSQVGASITFALLIFLVCAVVSGVVVVAASTSAGRMSQLAQSDQRYYAVTSAGELLRGVFDNVASVTVDYEKETRDNTGAIDTPRAVTKMTVAFKDGSTSLSIKPDDTSKSIASILARASGDLVGALGGVDLPASTTFTLALTDDTKAASPFDKAALDCNITETVQENGLVVFEVSNAVATGVKTVYSLKILFKSNIKELATDDKTLFGKAEVTWSLHSVEKVR